MVRVATSVVIAVPPALCIESIRTSLGDERILKASRTLRGDKSYAGWVTDLVPEQRVEVVYSAFDPTTRRRYERAGWRVVYDFTPAGPGHTLAEVSVEYGALAAVMGWGTTRAQAENEVMRSLAALVVLEVGLHARPTE